MKKIKLTKNKYTIVDDADFEYLNQYNWYINTGGYAVRQTKRINGKQSTIALHKFLLGSIKGKEIDHINGDRLDNQRSNLRICTKSENQKNKLRHKDSNSPFKGVYATRYGRWEARINQNYKQIYIGTFYTIREAALAYNKKAVELFGQFSSLNKIYA